MDVRFSTGGRPALDGLCPERVCFIKPSALGDIVQSLPVLAALRDRWPQAHLAWVVRPGLAGILENHPDIDQLIEFHVPGGWRQVDAVWQLARRLRKAKFDLAIDLQGLARSGLMCLATGAPRRIGFSNAREGAAWAYTDRVALHSMNESGVLRNWRIARALGCAGEPPAARLGLTPELRSWATEQLAGIQRPLVAIHVGAQWETKRWPATSFAQLAQWAQREIGAGIVLVGGRGERPFADEVGRFLPAPALNLAERTNLLELAAVLEQADVVCSGDSGPMHLAAALGTRVVGIFTCTSPVRSGPYGPGHRIITTCVACAASYRKRCGSMICMEELSAARVWPQLRRALVEEPNRVKRAG